MYLCTTRRGLYRDFTDKILDGAFFGIARHGEDVFLFGHRAQDIHCPNMQGYIIKYTPRTNTSEEIISGLDNGSHQMMIYKDELYLLETYLQRILILNLKDKSVRRVKPLGDAINGWYKKNNLNGDISNYKHINAITAQDDRFYLMCPNLKNKLGPDGIPTQERQNSFIAVFDPEWHEIDRIDTGRYFCHDLVLIGHEMYFSDSNNIICKVNLVTHEVSDVYIFDQGETGRKICRGLSMAVNGDVFVGTHDFNGNDFVVNVNTNQRIIIDSTPCCILKMDGTDYNDTTSPLRQSQVTSIKDFGSLAMMRSIDPKLPGTDPNDVYKLLSGQKTINTHRDLNLRNKMKLKEGFLESGSFFVYPAGHGMNWHTNQHQVVNDIGLYNWRMYSIYATGDSYFLYRHPISDKIHVVKDVTGFCNVFKLVPTLWHSVLCKSGTRISHGLKFGDEVAKSLNLIPEVPPNFVFKFEIRDGITIVQDHIHVPPVNIFQMMGPVPRTSEFFSLYSDIFNLVSKSEFHFKISELKDMVYLEHEVGSSDEWRLDIDKGKLGIIVQLSNSEEYEGGDIEFNIGGDTPFVAHRDKGTVVVFPSYMVYHTTQVTRGCRKSLIGWVAGPPFI